MSLTYTARYEKIDAGFFGQLVEWPEVLTEGRDLDDCRTMLRDALREMIAAYADLGRTVPAAGGLIEPIAVEMAEAAGEHDVRQPA